MNRPFVRLLAFAALGLGASVMSVHAESARPPVAIAIHGGAGTLLRSEITPELEAQFRAALDQAVSAGHAVLTKGGSSLDAVEAAVRVMEDSPLFNAGKGAVFTHDGKNELDAAIMESGSLKAGAVAGVTTLRNPITAARRVMEHSPHVMLIGAGAEQFAEAQGLERVPPEYFFTERRWQQLQKVKEKGGTKLSEDADKAGNRKQSSVELPDRGPFSANEQKFGTVGAVALDARGVLAAATSTGGMTNKRWGRVGDAPIIGSGTYANSHCAVSATGHGEYFIRAAVAHDICARVEYLGEPVDVAARQVVMEKLVKMGGEGGVIAIDKAGRISQPFNSKGMYRAAIDADGKKSIAIFGE